LFAIATSESVSNRRLPVTERTWKPQCARVDQILQIVRVSHRPVQVMGHHHIRAPLGQKPQHRPEPGAHRPLHPVTRRQDDRLLLQHLRVALPEHLQHRQTGRVRQSPAVSLLPAHSPLKPEGSSPILT
jgi:hypothetical protein